MIRAAIGRALWWFIRAQLERENAEAQSQAACANPCLRETVPGSPPWTFTKLALDVARDAAGTFIDEKGYARRVRPF